MEYRSMWEDGLYLACSVASETIRVLGYYFVFRMLFHYIFLYLSAFDPLRVILLR